MSISGFHGRRLKIPDVGTLSRPRRDPSLSWSDLPPDHRGRRLLMSHLCPLARKGEGTPANCYISGDSSSAAGSEVRWAVFSTSASINLNAVLPLLCQQSRYRSDSPPHLFLIG